MSAPWTDVAFVGVYWNEGHRLERLLSTVRPWFSNVTVGVQKSDDDTLDIARRYADRVIEDRHHGICEPTIGKILAAVPQEWVFLVSGDEMPSDNLLGAFQDILDHAKEMRGDAYWIRMISSIEGVDYPSEQDNHLRVFKRRLGWPTTMHSRPSGMHEQFWRPEDTLRHDRSMDEFAIDYLRYISLSGGNLQWLQHNQEMLYNACTATAAHYGWPYVKAYPWWPEVRRIAFKDVEPQED